MMAVGKENAADAAPAELRPMSEEAIARRLFGDLADDVLLLRKHGHSVARFRADFRVDREVLRYDQVQAKAEALRKFVLPIEQNVLHARRTKSRSPTIATSPEQPKSNAGVVPSRKGGNAEERDTHSKIRKPARVDVAGERMGGAASTPVPPAISDVHCEHCRPLVERIDFLFTVVAEAIGGRRVCLVDQASGLERLEAILRRPA